MSEENIHQITTRKSDTELASEYKENMRKALEPVLEAMKAARNDGFYVQWAIGTDYAGRPFISMLELIKKF